MSILDLMGNFGRFKICFIVCLWFELPLSSLACNILRTDQGHTLNCSGEHQIQSLPYLSKEDYLAVISINVEDQESLTNLGKEEFKNFRNLSSICCLNLNEGKLESTIRNSSLKYIDPHAFRLTSLHRLVLVDNPIEYLPHTLGDTLGNARFSKWLQSLLSNATSLGSLYEPYNWTCLSLNGTRHDLMTFNLSHCDPVSFSGIKPNSSLSAVCYPGFMEGEPVGPVDWAVADLANSGANYTVTNSSGHGVNLTVFNIRLEDSGIIECNSNSQTAQLRILMDVPPKIVRFRKEANGTKAFLRYDVLGTPPLSLRWFIHSAGSATELLQNQYDLLYAHEFSTVDGVTGYFRVKDDAYVLKTYTLVVTNWFGEVSTSLKMRFNLNDYPGIPGNVSLPGGVVTTPQTATDNLKEEIVGAVLGGLFVVLVTITILVLIQRHYNKSWLPCCAGTDDVDVRGGGKRPAGPLGAITLKENPNYLQDLSINSQCFMNIDCQWLTVVETLGEGAFGVVYLGTCSHITEIGETIPVAIKVLKGNCIDEQTIGDFQREAEMMGSLNHKNIVTMYGVSFSETDMMMIFEYMKYGDLNKFLRDHGPDSEILSRKSESERISLTVRHLLEMTKSIASGMAYLAAKRLVHRDLAARNCLVDEDFVVKVGDFGMSRDIYSTDYYKISTNTLLPIRWMAPECLLYRRFTLESDIWSFGVLMWEVFTYARQPWFEFSNTQVFRFKGSFQVADVIQHGRWLPKPDNCFNPIYHLMTQCWARQPEERSTMAKICSKLAWFLENYDALPSMDSADGDAESSQLVPNSANYVNTSEHVTAAASGLVSESGSESVPNGLTVNRRDVRGSLVASVRDSLLEEIAEERESSDDDVDDDDHQPNSLANDDEANEAIPADRGTAAAAAATNNNNADIYDSLEPPLDSDMESTSSSQGQSSPSTSDMETGQHTAEDNLSDDVIQV